ncbi:SUMF1/EgtB/PvdO family nonheme iron enzyme [Maritimibacter sp. DP07]|jgi:formylglycine-generating enzyme required for sulfatase activity|uniref:SUMF1/EgtB/PvdO family nonheme iron enzyme n=1 Tax=Maritimibacter harenae TaxID=2606218 RepID=A0A845M2K7_9RHOB|nr:SUMF1/EgtB/PvdO family nonheme iron enzyme [Maritimibacter harenae]
MRKAIAALGVCLALVSGGPGAAATLAENNEAMFRLMQEKRGVTASQIARIREIFNASGMAGQGNPAVTRHPMTPQQAAAKVPGDPYQYYRNARFERICGRKYMAPLYDPATERPEDAEVCVDMFEYPNVPMAYPVTWISAREAALVCAAEGKRMGDAHEWEGAAAGALLEPDYRFDLGSHGAMRAAHNAKWGQQKTWTYGPQWRRGICAQNSSKSPGCNGGSWSGCGSNTYPVGAFPNCRSGLGVYDLEGNAAEHMNLPMAPSQMASRGSTTLGVTEMKGSWFIWDKIRAHEEWARWRAPYWHGSRVMSTASHRNYHLGFRCFRDVR